MNITFDIFETADGDTYWRFGFFDRFPSLLYIGVCEGVSPGLGEVGRLEKRILRRYVL